MTLFDNPIALEKLAEQLEAMIFNFQLRLKKSEIDESGPFIGKPELTERAAFQEIRESKLPDELKAAWLRFCFRFTEARINGPHRAALAHAYRVERYLIDDRLPITMSLQEMFFSVLSMRGQRQRYLDILANRASSYRTLTFELWARRVELASRAGFASLDAVEAPTTGLVALAQSVLKRTEPAYTDLVSNHLEALLNAALASETQQGYPARLSPRQLREFLGESGYFEGLTLRVKPLPLPLAPTSYARALMRLGEGMVDASAPRGQPFVIARDPSGLMRKTLGALLGSLLESEVFQRQRCQVSPVHASAQARELMVSGLIHLRVCALRVLLRAVLCANHPSSFESDYEALCHETFGFALPSGLVGLFPRVPPDAGQRFLGLCLANEWRHRLVDEFDEDWFRNPRGIERVRETIHQTPMYFVDENHAKTAVDTTINDYLRRLS
jgi:hypothetical protein